MKAQKVYTASLCLLTFYILSIFFVPLVPMVNNEKTTVINEETEELNVNDNSEIQSPSKTIPSHAANYVPAGSYPWWDPNFGYRVPLQINSTYIDRINYTVRIPMNFTKYLKFVNWSGTFNEYSVRVIEYDSTPAIITVNPALPGTNASVVPSLFIKTRDFFNAQTNATGQLLFQINGNASANTNRTFMVYFDITETNRHYSISDDLKWKLDYNFETDVVGIGTQNLAYGCRYKTDTTGGSLTIWDDKLQETLYNGVPSAPMNVWFDTIAGDFDGNGNIELLTSDRNTYFHVMDINPVTLMWSHWKQSSGSEDFSFEVSLDAGFLPTYNFDWVLDDIAAADIDNDGCTEIIGTYYSGNTVADFIVIMNFTKSGGFYTLKVENFIQSSHVYNNWREFAIADFNFDGNYDIIVGTWSSGTNYNITVYINRGLPHTSNGTFFYVKSYLMVTTTNPINAVGMRVADIDYDGNIEIVQSDNDRAELRVMEYNRQTNQLVVEYIFNSNTRASIGDLYDIDYDGRIELLVGGFVETGTSTFTTVEVKTDRVAPASDLQITNIGYHRICYPRAGDIDNDGKVECVVGSWRKSDTTWKPKVMAIDSTGIKWSSPDYYESVGDYYGSQLSIFGAWDSKVLRREPTSFIYNGEVKDSDLNIQVLDIDKAPVQNVKVHIKNATWSIDSITDSTGQVKYTYLKNGLYDLELNITTDMGGLEQTFFTEIGIQINNSYELTTNRIYNTSIWQMAFDMKDIAGNSVPLGFVLIYNGSYEESGSIIANISTANGWKTGEKFVWFNRTDVANYYNISAYYNNPSYNPQITQLNYSTALQTTDNINQGWFNNSLKNIDYSGPHSGSGDYKHIWSFYANGSSSDGFGNQRLNWANISINNVADYLYKVDILLLLENEDTRNVGTYEFTPGTVTDWNKEISLWSGVEKGYGIRIFAYASNQTVRNNGTISVTLEEEYTKTIYVPLAKYYMNFIDSQGNPAAGVFVRVYNDSISYDQKKSLVNLTTSEMGDALGSAGNPFWYLVKPGTENYTVKLYLAAGIEPSFCNASEFPGKLEKYYNFSLKEYSSMNFQAQLDMSQIFTKIYVIQAPPSSLNFLGNAPIAVNITAQSIASGFEYNQSISANVILRVYNSQTDQIIFTRTNLNNPSTGIYEYTLNPQTDGIALALNDYNYYMEFTALTPGYGANPTPERRSFVVNPISTSLLIRQGTTTTEISSLELYWNQKITISAFYYNTPQATSISAAAVSYKTPWSLSASTLQETPGYPGYYSFDLNTTDAGNVGQFTLEFFAQQTNYTAQNNIKLYLNVKPLKTQLNFTDSDDILFTANIPTLYKTKAHNLSLIYWDNITNVGVEQAVSKHYIYQFSSKDGNKTAEGEGDLIEIGGGLYILDFDTEYKDEGTYFFEVQIAKPNYVAKVASISMIIDTMPMIYDFGKALEGGYLVFSDTQGAKIGITLNLKDREKNNAALVGSKVTLVIGADTYDFTDNGDGTYTYLFDTANIEAFAAPVVKTGKIFISKANYTTYEINTQITIEMPEIFPGVPTFYFSIVLGAVLLLVGTLTMNKVIQNARIPAFVKLIDKTGKFIGGKKNLEDGRVAPTVEQDMVERFGKDWTALDLNLEDILGLNVKPGAEKAGPGDNQGGA